MDLAAEIKVMDPTRTTCIIALNRTIQAVAEGPYAHGADTCGMLAQKLATASAELAEILPRAHADPRGERTVMPKVFYGGSLLW